jgi:hypothetical protein
MAAMKRILTVAALAAVALAPPACDKPGTKSAYNNSGQSATPAMPAQQAPSESPAETKPEPLKAQTPTSDSPATQAPAVSDTTSPNPARPPQGDTQAPKS